MNMRQLLADAVALLQVVGLASLMMITAILSFGLSVSVALYIYNALNGGC